MWERHALGELGRVGTGLTLTRIPQRSVGAPREFRVLQVKDVAEHGGVSALDGLQEMTLPDAMARYAAAVGDVLVTARGSQLKVGVVGAETAGALVTGNLLHVRLRPERLRPEVLLAYLQSPSGQGALVGRVRSTHMLIALTVGDLAALHVPVPPLAVQDRIAALWSATQQVYQAGLRAAELRLALGRAATSSLLNPSPSISAA